MTLRKLRLRAVWLIAVPFFLFSHPTVAWVGMGAVLVALGLWIRAWSAGTIHKDEELTTTGPYAFTRNPLYMGRVVSLGFDIENAGDFQPIVEERTFDAVQEVSRRARKGSSGRQLDNPDFPLRRIIRCNYLLHPDNRKLVKWQVQEVPVLIDAGSLPVRG